MKKAILFIIIMCLALLINACSAKSDEPASGPQIEDPAKAAPSEASTIPTAESEETGGQ